MRGHHLELGAGGGGGLILQKFYLYTMPGVNVFVCGPGHITVIVSCVSLNISHNVFVFQV